MGDVKQALIDDADAHSVENALALAAAPDPYHYDTAIAALCRIAAQTSDPAAEAVARTALAVCGITSPPWCATPGCASSADSPCGLCLEHQEERLLGRVPPDGGRYATEREYREHIEATTRPARA